MPAESLEYFVSTTHWLDAFTPPMEQHAQYLADTVKRILVGVLTLVGGIIAVGGLLLIGSIFVGLIVYLITQINS